MSCHITLQAKSTNAAANTISICPEFATKLDPGAYDNCGLAIPGERGNICAGDDIVSDVDREGCQAMAALALSPLRTLPRLDILSVSLSLSLRLFSFPPPCYQVMPSMHYALENASLPNQVLGRTLNFLNDPNGATPPYFEGFQVGVMSVAECWWHTYHGVHIYICIIYYLRWYSIVYCAHHMAILYIPYL